MSLRSNGVNQVRLLRKIRTRLRCTKLCINGTSSASVSTEVHEITEQSETPQNMSMGSNGVDRVRLLQQIPTRLCCTILCINDTTLANFVLKFVQ
jgi:hypothetical protein